MFLVEWWLDYWAQPQTSNWVAKCTWIKQHHLDYYYSHASTHLFPCFFCHLIFFHHIFHHCNTCQPFGFQFLELFFISPLNFPFDFKAFLDFNLVRNLPLKLVELFDTNQQNMNFLVFKSHFMDSPSSWWPMMINDPSLGEFNQCIAKLNTDNMCWLLSAWNIIVHKLKIVWFSIRTMNTIYVIEYSSIWFNMLMIIHKDGVDFIYI